MEPDRPYQTGEVVTLWRFRFVPKRPKKGRSISLVAAKGRGQVVVIQHWRAPVGRPMYSARPLEPFGKLAMCLRRRASPHDRIVFFEHADVLGNVNRSDVTGDDYSPVE